MYKLETHTSAWREIPGLCGYQVNGRGEVRSWWVATNRGAHLDTEPHMLRPYQRADGYMVVRLRRNGKRYFTTVQRLVCLAFHGEPADGTMEASHIDGDALNNSPENLQWETPKANNGRKRKHHARTKEMPC